MGQRVTLLIRRARVELHPNLSMQHSFRPSFCSGVSSCGTILAQTFLISKFSVKIRCTDDFLKPKCFWYHSNSHLAVTEHKRMHMIDVSTFAWGGGASWSCIVLRCLHGLSENAGPPFTQFFPLGHSFHSLWRYFRFCTILAQFCKKFDLDPLFRLFVNLHLD